MKNSDQIQSNNARGRVKDAPSGHWVYKLLPPSIWPYAQLARWDRPIGWQLLMWPCWWSVGMIAVVIWPFLHTGDMVATWIWQLVLFAIGAIAMRGAGCTFNDLVDHKIDNMVDRTRSRPLPSGQVSRLQAKIFMVIQSLVGLLVLLQFNTFTIWLGIGSLIIVAIYPFMKRITYWPQFFLGLAFNWGALMGWAATAGSLSWPPVLLYIAGVLWTIGYDTIYAHQDKEDDAIVGVRSTARLFGEHSKVIISALYSAVVVLIAISFACAHLPWIAYIGLVAAALHMIWQMRVLDIDDNAQCLMLFKSNNRLGMMIFAGLILALIF